MLLLKSFYRKRVVRIYFIIFLLIFILLLFVNNNRNYYTDFINDYNKRYFIVLTTNKDQLQNLNALPNVKKVTKTIISNIYFLVKDEDSILRDNEIAINSTEKLKYEINDYFPINYNNNIYNFKIKSFFSDINTNKCIINSNLFEELNSNISEYNYLIEFKDYNKKDTLYKAIEDKITYKTINTTSNRPQNSEIETFTIYKNLLTILLYGLGGAFIIVTIITIYNILIDEAKSSYLYSCLGYNKKVIKKFNIIKIISLIFSSFLLSLVIFFIVALIFSVK